MNFVLQSLGTKKDIDRAIKTTKEKVLVLRFGIDNDPVCIQQDDILSKCEEKLSNMAKIYTVSADKNPIYTKYFDITLVPATIFFFNGRHMRVDFG